MFPSCVDNLFRVQVNKSRYRIETTLLDVISNRCSSTINRIANKTTRMNRAIRAFSHPSKVPSAEEVNGSSGRSHSKEDTRLGD